MANDCLVKDLKGSAQNTNILKLGEFRYKVTKNLSFIPVSVRSDQTLEAVSGNVTINGETSYNLLHGHENEHVPVTGTGEFSVPNKYDIYVLYGSKANFDISLLYYVTGLRLTYFVDSAGESIDFLLSLGKSTLNTLLIHAEGYQLSGNISVFNSIPSKNTITSLNITKNRNITLNGDLKYLGVLKECVEYSSTTEKTQISGSIEDFVAVKRGTGKTTGSCSFVFLGENGLIKFQNETVVNTRYNTISWTANTITYNDVTINNDTVIVL